MPADQDLCRRCGFGDAVTQSFSRYSFLTVTHPSALHIRFEEILFISYSIEAILKSKSVLLVIMVCLISVGEDLWVPLLPPTVH